MPQTMFAMFTDVQRVTSWLSRAFGKGRLLLERSRSIFHPCIIVTCSISMGVNDDYLSSRRCYMFNLFSLLQGVSQIVSDACLFWVLENAMLIYSISIHNIFIALVHW